MPRGGAFSRSLVLVPAVTALWSGCLGHVQGPETWLPVCGNGVVGGEETCDDGNTVDGDGCTAACAVEQGFTCDGDGPDSCLAIPPAPALQGETSAGHVRLTWTWPQVPGAHTLQVRLGVLTQELPGDATQVTLEVPGPGARTLELTACNAHRACGPTASFTTTVEFWGSALLSGWRGVARAMTTTALGNVAAVSCHNCYNGPGDEVLNAQDMAAAITKALGRGADLIEVDVAELGGVLHATHDDGVSGDGVPTLADVLAIPALQQSDAMLFVEIKEQDGDPSWTARELLAALDAHRMFARNGRPVFVRGFEWTMPVVLEVQRLAAEFPLVAPYLRYSLLLWADDAVTPEAMERRIQTGVVERGLHAVELHHQHPMLWAGLAQARALGLLVNVYTLPAEDGDLLALVLRDQVDILTADLRADRVAQVVAGADALLQVDVSRGNLVASRSLRGVARRPLETGTQATRFQHGTPVFVPDPVHAAWGGALQFSAGALQALATFKEPPLEPGGRLVLQVAAQLDRVELAVGERMVLLDLEGPRGLFVDVVGEENGTFLRFGGRDRDGARVHRFPLMGLAQAAPGACRGAWGVWTGGIHDGEAFHVTGVLEEDGTLRMWVNLRCAGSPAPRARAGAALAGGLLLGAAALQEAPLAADFLDGRITSAGVAVLAPYRPDGELEN